MMHVYSSDGDDRRVVPFVLAAASIALVVGLRILLSKVGYDAAVNISLFSSFGIYGLLHLLFDRYAWKWPVVRALAGTVPSLEGRWKGVLRSSHSELAKEHDVEIEIVQTWSRINILLESPRSRSESQMAIVRTTAPSRHELVWEYIARTKDGKADDAFLHFGITRLAVRVNSETENASGSYYTEQKRDTYGLIEVSKV